LMRRAAREKASHENSRVAAALAMQVPEETAMLGASLAGYPSWLNGQFGPSQASLAQAEAEIVEDATFLARLAEPPGSQRLRDRYRSYGEFKAEQRSQW